MAARNEEGVVRLRPAKRAAGGVNAVIGARIKAYRNQAGLTQAELGKRVALSQQQIQKYEKGQDRVPVDKLQEICAALEVEPSAVYRALDGVPVEQAGFAEAEGPPFEADADVARLVRAYQRIEDKAVRKRVLDLVRALGTGDPDRSAE